MQNRRRFLTTLSLVIFSLPAWARPWPLIAFFGRRTVLNLAKRVIVGGLTRAVGRNRIARELIKTASKVESVISNINDAVELVHLVEEWGGAKSNGETYIGKSESRSEKKNLNHVKKCANCRRIVKQVVMETPFEVRKEIHESASLDLQVILKDDGIKTRREIKPSKNKRFSTGW